MEVIGRRSVTLIDGVTFTVADLKGLGQDGPYSLWFGLAPDDSLLVVRDVGTHEIYARDWEAP